jgi:hypothetical protein
MSFTMVGDKDKELNDGRGAGCSLSQVPDEVKRKSLESENKKKSLPRLKIKL